MSYWVDHPRNVINNPDDWRPDLSPGG
jgi:hypothetical protein